MTDKKRGATAKVDIFMPIYIGDYLKGTTFLTTEQHGAYLLLIFALWQHDGEIPFQESALCMITKLNPDAWSNAWSMLGEYFQVNDGKLSQKRLTKELVKAKGQKVKAHKRAKTAAEARWSKKESMPEAMLGAMPEAMLEDMLEECPSPTPSPTPPKAKKPKPSFIPPSSDAVKKYMVERGNCNSSEAERFVDFYASKGWLVGKNKMKDWKAAVRNWERGNSSSTQSATKTPEQMKKLRAEYGL